MLSIVIPSHHRDDLLRACLRSVTAAVSTAPAIATIAAASHRNADTDNCWPTSTRNGGLSSEPARRVASIAGRRCSTLVAFPSRSAPISRTSIWRFACSVRDTGRFSSPAHASSTGGRRRTVTNIGGCWSSSRVMKSASSGAICRGGSCGAPCRGISASCWRKRGCAGGKRPSRRFCAAGCACSASCSPYSATADTCEHSDRRRAISCSGTSRPFCRRRSFFPVGKCFAELPRRRLECVVRRIGVGECALSILCLLGRLS